MTYELNIAELDKVSGGTTVEEAVVLMNKWNAAITLAGQAAEGRALFHPMPKPPVPGHH